jgi:hypothetical protein
VSTIAYGVTEGFFDVFRLPMALGRAFTHRSTPGAAPAVVLNRSGADLFGSDPSIVESFGIANVRCNRRRSASRRPLDVRRVDFG